MNIAEIGQAILNSPSPIIGGVLGGLITGGFFGWVSHIRSVRPILVFYRDDTEPAPKWKIKNIGEGPALNIRIRDYESKTVIKRKVRPYALEPGVERDLKWVTGGFKLEADYTDAYGRTSYRSTASDNETNSLVAFATFGSGQSGTRCCSMKLNSTF
ncbi:MAG: hypothetical protein ABSF22_21775 [Bryobacteraceae bacterium]|jgi:hypothetical protein